MLLACKKDYLRMTLVGLGFYKGTLLSLKVLITDFVFHVLESRKIKKKPKMKVANFHFRLYRFCVFSGTDDGGSFHSWLVCKVHRKWLNRAAFV